MQYIFLIESGQGILLLKIQEQLPRKLQYYFYELYRFRQGVRSKEKYKSIKFL